MTLAKIGRAFGSDMFNAYYSLNGAVYGIYTSTGTRVGAITTDGNGKGTLQNLKLGSYYALEEKAPAGYILNTAKLPFELKYAGQLSRSPLLTSIRLIKNNAALPPSKKLTPLLVSNHKALPSLTVLSTNSTVRPMTSS